VFSEYGYSWTQRAASGNLAMDTSGMKVAAVQADGFLYISTTGGNTWTKTSAPSLGAIACDNTFQYLAGSIRYGYIYTSSSGGTTWTKTSAPSSQWIAIQSDLTGTNLAACSCDGQIYTSTSG